MGDYDTKLLLFGGFFGFGGFANQDIFGFGKEEKVEHLQDAERVDH